MKKSKLFVLGGLTLGLAFSLFGFSRINNETQMVKADAPTFNGSIFVQKNDNDMKYTGSKLVAHFFDDSNPKNTAWGDAILNDGKTYQEYSWTLNFEPTYIILLRVDGNSWNIDNPWSNIWCRTGDVPLNGFDVLWMTGASNESGGHGTYSMETFVMDDNDQQIAELSDKKIRSDGEGLEVFGEVNLPANQKFYVKKTSDGDKKYNTFTTLNLIGDNFAYDGDYIKNEEAGTYEFYFNFNENSLYITDPAIAAADEWAQDFLNGQCSGSKSSWGTAASDFDALSSDAKALLINEIHISNDANADTYIKQAVQRYDYVLQRFGIGNANTDEGGYQDFMGRVSGGKLSLAPIGYRNTISEEVTDSNVVTILFITVTLLAAATGFLVIRRRKHNQ